MGKLRPCCNLATPLSVISSAMKTQNRQLRRRIMQRVWWNFTLSLFTSAVFVQGLAFGASVMIFRELVFVERVISNFLARPVGEIPQFLTEILQTALSNGEFLTLLSLGIVMMTSLSFGFNLYRVRWWWSQVRATQLRPSPLQS
jgi:hypothetical protein